MPEPVIVLSRVTRNFTLLSHFVKGRVTLGGAWNYLSKVERVAAEDFFST